MTFFLRIPLLATAARYFLSKESILANLLALLVLMYIPYRTYIFYAINRLKYREHELVNTPLKAFGMALLAAIIQVSASVLVGSTIASVL